MPIDATEGGGGCTYRVELTDEAVYALAEITSERIYRRLRDFMGMLERFPFYGQEYDPYYASAFPPITCRVLYCGHVAVYYHVDEEREVVTVLAVEDQRRDPLHRFEVME